MWERAPRRVKESQPELCYAFEQETLLRRHDTLVDGRLVLVAADND